MAQRESQEKKISEKSYGVVPIHEDRGIFLFLLVREKTGQWGFPKGHPHKKESEMETVRREFIEETGIIDFEIIEGPSFLARYHIGDEKKH